MAAHLYRCASCWKPASISATTRGAGTRRCRPTSSASRNGIHIIDLEQTVPLLHQGLQAVRDVVAGGGRVLFVGTKRQAQEPVAEAAKRCGQYYVNYRWLGGMLTNFKTISQSIKRLRELDERITTEQSGPDQARAAGADARPRQARTRAWRHQGDGRPARHPVRDRHQQGGDRGRRGQHVAHPGRRDPRLRTRRRTASPIRSRAMTTRCARSISIAIWSSGAVLDGLQAELAASGVDIGARAERRDGRSARRSSGRTRRRRPRMTARRCRRRRPSRLRRMPEPRPIDGPVMALKASCRRAARGAAIEKRIERWPR